jgi:hypothetical protein
MIINFTKSNYNNKNKMFSCFFTRKPREYYIEERKYDSEKILIDNDRLKLVCDGKIVVESGGFPEAIKHARFFAIDTRRFIVVILPREMIVLNQEKLDEITKIKLDTTEILCLEIDTRKNAHKSTIYVGTKSGKIEVYIFHVRNMKLARIYVFDCFRPIYGIYIVYEKARVVYANFSRWNRDSYERV